MPRGFLSSGRRRVLVLFGWLAYLQMAPLGVQPDPPTRRVPPNRMGIPPSAPRRLLAVVRTEASDTGKPGHDGGDNRCRGPNGESGSD
ncbi:hypothetical protein MRX96_011836 [Rhipicephalus microplus]